MLTYSETDTHLTYAFKGLLDTNQCMSFEKELLDKISASAKKIIFDLKEVTYVSSSFLRICTQTVISKGDGALTAINLSPQVKKVFKIAGIDELLGAS